jgi:hypothetical protein
MTMVDIDVETDENGTIIDLTQFIDRLTGTQYAASFTSVTFPMRKALCYTLCRACLFKSVLHPSAHMSMAECIAATKLSMG